MSMICSISGGEAECPVVTKFGHVFDKKLLHNLVQRDGRCPITHNELDWEEDVIEVDSTQHRRPIRPRTTHTSSIPSMLNLFQNEWEGVLSDTHKLRNYSNTTQEQLKHALYQHDAACRVIERLIRERDQARAQVTELQAKLAAATAQRVEEPPLPETGMAEDMVEIMKELQKTLSADRRQRSTAGVMEADKVKEYTCKASHTLHATSAPGITCMGVHPISSDGIVTGGVDGNLEISRRKPKAGKDEPAFVSEGILAGHKKRVLSVGYHPKEPNCIISTSQDATCRVWMQHATGATRKWTCSSTIKTHIADVTGAVVHQSGALFATGSKDRSFALHDMSSGHLIRHVKDLAAGIGSLSFHPDGLLMATGMQNAIVTLWDSTKQKAVETLEGHKGGVNCISFSENGYYLVTAGEDKTVRLWDLRKVHELQCLEFDAPVTTARFDKTGTFVVACAGNSVKIHNLVGKKELNSLVEFKGHTDLTTDAVFGPNTKHVMSIGIDRCVKVWE